MNLLKNPGHWANEYWWPPALPNPKIVDFYDERECHIWYLFTEEGSDLELEECADEEQGEKPEWLTYEIEYSGHDIYDFGGSTETHVTFGPEGIGRTATWALENGIAPYQPFRIRIEPPRYYNCSWEYPQEMDVEHTWWVDRVMRISDFDASRRWEHWLADRKMHFEMTDDHSRWKNNILAHTVEWMHLDWNPYHSSKAYRDGYPDGISVSLVSNGWIEGHHEHRRWASGYSDDGDRDEALRAMLKEAKKQLPHIHGNKIRGMAWIPVRSKFQRIR
jgi:hypothetical protein